MEFLENGRRSMWLRILLAVLIALLVILAAIAVWLGWSYYGGGTASKKSVLTVTFDCSAEESELDYQPEDQSVAYGETASCPAFPTRTDYAFHGWYMDAACTSAYDFSTAVTADLTLYADWVDLDSEEAQITDEECETFFDCLETFSDIYSQYADEDGYVPEAQTSEVIDAVTEAAEQYRAQGILTYYNASEDTVYMEFASCLTYLFTVPEEGTSGDPTELDSMAVFPFYKLDWAWNSSENVASRDDKITELMETFSDIEKYTGTSISWKDGFDYLAGCDILIWDGHGYYDDDLGPLLLTSETLSDWEQLLFDLGLDGNEEYQQLNRLFCTKVITIAAVNNVNVYALTPTYVRFYFPDLNDAFVYLSACRSGQDSRLADAFLAIGAEVVIANAGTQNIDTEYTQTMVKKILALIAGEDSDYPGYYSVQEALDLMVDLGMGTDTTGKDAYPKIFYASGNADAVNYTLWAGLTGTIASEDDIDMSQVKVILYNTSTNSRVGTVTPDSDGSFSFDQLDGGDSYAYSLHVTYEGTSVYTQSGINITAHRYLDLGKITLDAEGADLTVCVVDEEGSAVSGASVSVGGDSLGTTGTDGTVSGYFLDGTYTVAVEGPSGYGDGSAEAVIEGSDVTVTVTLKSEISAWAKAYLELLSDVTVEDSNILYKGVYEEEYVWNGNSYGGFGLVYINNDDIPELVLNGIGEATGAYFFSYNSSGELDELRTIRHCYYFTERGNVINAGGGTQGSWEDILYRINEAGNWELLAQGQYSYDLLNSGNTYGHIWNGLSVTAEEYDSCIEQYINPENAVSESQIIFYTLENVIAILEES